jgi:endogenous inhibitor of DNA gyrase (YacG/DUF329 family)
MNHLLCACCNKTYQAEKAWQSKEIFVQVNAGENGGRKILRQGIKTKQPYTQYTCPQCGKVFTSYGNKKRKYCSHNCYIKSRFWSEEEYREADFEKDSSY